MNKFWLVLSTGFALFSMFFGSGNLVYPIAVGQESQGHYVTATLGFLLTGVLVPFLGIYGMMLYKGDLASFFSCFTKKGTFIFSLCALALMGPFGVLARCLTVAHGALQLIFPHSSLILSSLVLCTTVYLLTVNKNKIVPVLGSYLTPFLLLSIGVIAFFGLKSADLTQPVAFQGVGDAFKLGFFTGYQIMDLLAAFFFSSFILNQLKGRLQSQSGISKNLFLQASLVGFGLLSLVYVALIILGWAYAPMLKDVPPQEMLGVIALEVLGPFAAPCVCLAVVLACLTTAIVLATLFSDFLHTEVLDKKLSNKQTLLITLCIGFLVSTLDFSGIAMFLAPILEMVYPALIVLTVLNIAHKTYGLKTSHWPVTLTVVMKLCTV